MKVEEFEENKKEITHDLKKIIFFIKDSLKFFD